METPTLKIGEYRGVKIYIRRLFRETFEYLVSMDGEVFCNQVEIQREPGQRFAEYGVEDLESAVAFMLHVAQEFVDDRLFQKEEFHRFKNRWKRFRGKVEDKLFHIKYKLSNYLDKLHERKPKREASS